ncbi:MAG TPA: bifunctional aspartate kinase/diaminopimelate decarboxylase [Steroidobacteraceae bacterium]|nr:bifunctional aspartate kinase/diaminopimelate decarboxylase [Steroidobacteraceae bacterium]
MGRNFPQWVVLKFGGTSVSSLANWRNIAQITRSRLAAGERVLIVHSAVTGTTDKLEKLLEAALHGSHEEVFEAIQERHRRLAAELQIPVSAALERQFRELGQISAGVALVGELSDRTRARVMAAGELMATDLGARFLKSQGLDAHWLDARTVLKADERRGASAKASVLNATCIFTPDEAFREQLNALGEVVITQGFIASDADGNTVLLGRGGSDTSAAYFAAKLSAQRLEIWTDVPGMFSANPRSTPSARQLRSLHYDEAQEIASSGAKVLHPRCILPVRQYQIPLHVLATQVPDLAGTVLSADAGDGAAQVKAVCIKKGITLVAMDSPGMWHQVGFLADAFQIFKDHGMSVDLVSTSETNVTVSLDPAANALDSAQLDALIGALSGLCRARAIGPCASVSLVGRNIRGILHQLGEAFELFAELQVYLVSQAANDLNFTFVVDESQGDRLVDQLHELLIPRSRSDRALGPTWDQLFAPQSQTTGPARAAPWWKERRADLQRLMDARDCAYVYDRATLLRAARSVKGVASAARVLYAMKANPHPQVLQLFHSEGLDFDCVSRGEIEHLVKAVPRIDKGRILFTPNFIGREEYAWAFAQGVQVTLDSLHAIENWPKVFAGRDIFVRIDGGIGRGHHRHVRTGGEHSKFGIPVADIEPLAELVRAAGARVVGLHSHSGSGILDVANWEQTADLLAEVARRFPDVSVVDVGGGLGVPEHPEQAEFDLARLDTALARVKALHPHLSLWLEPGRYLVAQAGVLLARVTQLKSKGDTTYVGVATGMNSLIRPALYGAYHEIVNLTRVEDPATVQATVVGPICESGDVLGHDRLLPPTLSGDVLLVANTGAYGHAMSSRYTLREPAEEFCI